MGRCLEFIRGDENIKDEELKELPVQLQNKLKRRLRVEGSVSSGAMYRFNTDDLPGKFVLLMSFLFIAYVFMLHIWDNFNRELF